MKKLLILIAVLFLLPVASQAAITSAQVQYRSLNNNTLADSSVGTRNIGASAIIDSKLSSAIYGRVFITLFYDGTVYNTAGINSDGVIFAEPSNAMTVGSLTIEKVTAIQQTVSANNESFCLSCDNNTTYDTLVIVNGLNTGTLISFTNFATFVVGSKLNIRVSGGGTNSGTAYKVNFIIQAKYSIKND